MRLICCAFSLALAATAVQADTFGTGENAFTIPFVTVGDPGNAPDTTGAPNPAGAVAYEYRIGKYEVPEEAIRKANAASEAAGDPLGITIDVRGPQKPATRVSWFEAARFVNWLNADKGAPAAYKFDSTGDFQLWQPGDPGYNPANPSRNSQARYFLPSVDEWYKAAFYDPVTESYFDFPTGSDDAPIPVASGTDPGTAVWNQATGPADVQFAGGESPWGTVAQGGNIIEWQETAIDLSRVNAADLRGTRGDDWGLASSGNGMSSLAGTDSLPSLSFGPVGFRVSSVPEPASSLLATLIAYLTASRSRRSRHKRNLRQAEPLEDRRLLATLTVNSLEDFGIDNDNGALTLREAINIVNLDYAPQLPGGDVELIDDTIDPIGQNDRIVFAEFEQDGVTPLFDVNGEALIELMHTYQGFGSDSALVIAASVEIEAPIGKRVTLSASQLTDRRVLLVTETLDQPVVDVALTRLGITGGRGQTGAGVRLDGGSLRIEDSVLEDNRTAVSSGPGGGLFVTSLADDEQLEIIDSVFERNYAGNAGGGASVIGSGDIEIRGTEFNSNEGQFGGGGLYLRHEENSVDPDASWLIEDAVFFDNETVAGGGGMQVVARGDNGAIRATTFEMNRAGFEGGGLLATTRDLSSPEWDALKGTVVIEDSVFTRNRSTSNGGGVSLDFSEAGGQEFETGRVVFRDNIVSYNEVIDSVTNMLEGGGVYAAMHHGRMLIDRSSIHNNQASRDQVATFSEGGGLYIDAFANSTADRIVEVVNTTVSHNDAERGGGAYVNGPEFVAIRHSTITLNDAGESANATLINPQLPTGGGGLMVANVGGGDGILLDHTIIAGNTHSPNPPEFPVPSGLEERAAATALSNFTPDYKVTVVPNAYLDDDGDWVPGWEDPDPEDNPVVIASVIGVTDVPSFEDGIIVPVIQGPIGLLPATGELTRTLYNNGLGVAYAPAGSYVDAGTYTTANPIYQTPDLLSIIGTTVIDTDQLGPGSPRIEGGRIDIGAIEGDDFVAGDDDAPYVTNVIISGGGLSQHVFDFDQRLDAERTSNPTNPRVGIQLDTVPVGAFVEITVVFNEPVSAVEADLSLHGMRSAHNPKPEYFVPPAGTNEATWRFNEAEMLTRIDNYIIWLRDDLTDLGGNRLDGEWVNPSTRTLELNDTNGTLVSEFPSGDSVAGGDFRFVMTLMPGDSDLDGKIDNQSLNVLLGEWGMTVNDFVLEADWFGDGTADNNELNLLLSNWGLDLWEDANSNTISLFLIGDFNNDGEVDNAELSLLLGSWGDSTVPVEWVNGFDSVVDNGELSLLLGQWGLGFVTELTV